MTDENIELAKEHIKLAEDIVMEEARKTDDDRKLNEIKEAKFTLEKAEVEVEDLEKDGEEEKQNN